jgi:hypothetical protein
MRIGIFLLFVVASLEGIAQKELSFTDRVYETQIKTVQLYPNAGGQQDFLQPAAASVGQQNLLLEFDDLQDQRNNYYVKLIHCNYDWTKSNLSDLDFMENYNEYPITDYSLSSNTYVRYFHYRFAVPVVKYPGNYLLVAYRNDMSDLILSKRMMVYDNQIGLTKNNQFLGNASLNRGNQQFNFVLDYGDIQILNPTEAVHVNMRQNQRWDNAKFNLAPTFVRDDQSQLEYQFLDDSKQFSGGNEFRFVDFRSMIAPGQNTGSIDKLKKPWELKVAIDKPRSDQAYAQYRDINGNFVIDNADYGEGYITGNYLFVNFTLKTDAPVDGEVYVVGRFNDFERSPDNRMVYNQAAGTYQSQQFLKQGWYDYQYVVESKRLGANYIEGEHFETENTYEITIYNRPFRPDADLLIGYYLITLNPRN